MIYLFIGISKWFTSEMCNYNDCQGGTSITIVVVINNIMCYDITRLLEI